MAGEANALPPTGVAVGAAIMPAVPLPLLPGRGVEGPPKPSDMDGVEGEDVFMLRMGSSDADSGASSMMVAAS